MKSLPTVLISLCLLLTGASHEIVFAGDQTTKVSVITSLTSMPLAFTENQGQWDEQVLFRANAGGATMWFTKDGAYYQFTRRISSTNGENPPQGVGHPDLVGRNPSGFDNSVIPAKAGIQSRGRQMSTSAPLSTDAAHEDIRRTQEIETMMIKADFVGSNPTLRVVGEGLLEYKCNYFLGNDPAKWRTNVPNYQAIVYQEVYPGIDLKYYGTGKQMEYDFIVSPGADPSQIAVRYEGAKSLSVDAAGRLVVEIEWGEVVEQRPVVYQMSGGDRVSLASEYVLKGDQAFGFELPDGYDADLPLVIDPTLVYSTYLGGNDNDNGNGIAVDASGAAYVTGYTTSTDFPTLNPYQTYQGAGDVFVTKLSSSGSSLVYSTYLGGSNDDWGSDIAVDASGAAYVTGATYSTNFLTLNPYQTYQGAGDVFVTKLSSSGSSLVYSTYLGGSDHDRGDGIAVDGSGAAYVTGWTHSTDFPTENPYQTDPGDDNDDVFITKLSSSGSSLVYSTYLGGSNNDWGWGIAVDAYGAAYVTGVTYSTDFPTVNPYQTDQGGSDVFITKLSSSGSSLVYSTYLGGNYQYDYGWGIVVDDSGAAYVTGYTHSTDFPTENPYQDTFQGASDVFVTKLSSSGSSLVYSTYLGGNDDDRGWGIAVDASGAAYVTGATYSTNFPTLNPYQMYQGAGDVFVTKLSSSGSSLVYSTYLGGNDFDYGYGIAVDTFGCVHLTGSTSSTDFPTTPGAYDTSYNGGWDAFVAKLCESCCNHDGVRGDVNYDMSLNVADLTYIVDYLFRGGPAPPCPEEGDVNGDGNINIADLTYLVDYLFRGGPPPPPCP